MKHTIGFIGLGTLGTPIAINLLDRGHALHVYNRTASKTETLAAKGAIVCNSIAELSSKCNVVFTIVSDDAALKSICEKDGLLEHLSQNGVHISMSTILPQTSAHLANLHKAHGQHYVTSPVFGRPETAADRKMNFVVSGDDEIKKQIEPLLKDAGAAGVWDFGTEATAANTVKLCGNFLIASVIRSVGESIQLAEKSGVDPKLMWNMFTQTLFSSPVFINYSNVILQQRFDPAAFVMKLGLKDINLVLQQAESVSQPMPLASLLQEKLKELVDHGHENLDWSALSMAERIIDR
jgi:3-hydroxyisobutyrate dehydrogenase-like beta-hydroxyacid dehydrogenase